MPASSPILYRPKLSPMSQFSVTPILRHPRGRPTLAAMQQLARNFDGL
jgi:hypothetical protein